MEYDTSKIWKLINEVEKMRIKLACLKSTEKSSKRLGRVGFLGLSGEEVDLVKYRQKNLEDLEEKVRMQQ
ncbi:hypothetical protein L1887_10870 [Cichorium endivia]|nr:hypothetical protein L1887_10870 [Cichorium endivia]